MLHCTHIMQYMKQNFCFLTLDQTITEAFLCHFSGNIFHLALVFLESVEYFLYKLNEFDQTEASKLECGANKKNTRKTVSAN